jgi:hypothetical protein
VSWDDGATVDLAAGSTMLIPAVMSDSVAVELLDAGVVVETGLVGEPVG